MMFRRKKLEPKPERTDEDHEHEQREAARLRERLNLARQRLVRLEADLFRRAK